MNAYRFKIPFTTPLTFAGKVYREREGVLLERDGQWAEASPLPGFSAESIDDVISALRGDTMPPASLKFALSALETPIELPTSVPLNALLMGERSRILDQATACESEGCRAAKLKVGRGDLEAEIRLVRLVRNTLPAHVSLRLDANRAWSFKDATRFAEATRDLALEYIEEPLTEPHRLEELFENTEVKFALDESLAETNDISVWPNATALICKPTILGGFDEISRLADSGKPIVFSAAFESGVGVSRVAQLASLFSPKLAAGLDTLGWLTTDLLADSPQKQEGCFKLASAVSVDTSVLERIEL